MWPSDSDREELTGGFLLATYMQYLEPYRPCSYLPEETASLHYRFAAELPVEVFGELVRRGWRRMGLSLFRPRCPNCQQCRGIRLPVADFQPSKSQRRCLKRNADLEVRLQPASVSDEHVALYNAYHADMQSRRGWPEQSTTLDEYDRAFLAGSYPFAYEMQYRLQNRLVGLGLVDITPIGISSIYFFHAPELRAQALGVYSLLREIELCQQMGLEHLYLGYWVSRCPSMAYKADYHPHELLAEYVRDAEEPRWIREPSTGHP